MEMLPSVPLFCILLLAAISSLLSLEVYSRAKRVEKKLDRILKEFELEEK